jgi:hypothetical protein
VSTKGRNVSPFVQRLVAVLSFGWRTEQALRQAYVLVGFIDGYYLYKPAHPRP